MQIIKELKDTIAAQEFTRCREIVNEENRMAIRLLASVGIPLSIINMVAQTILSYRLMPLQRSLWLLFYFILLSFFDRAFLSRRTKYATGLIYLAEMPPMVVAILLGTIWDPAHPAVTFLMFIIAMPVFILDRPGRVFAVTTFWSALCAVCCLRFKVPETRSGDMFHILEFYLASIAVTFVVLRVRLVSLRSRERAQYHLEHDDLTNLRNRRSLEERVDLYLGKPLIVLLADLDQLTLYNDFYGHEVGDELLLAFTQIIRDAFGDEHCYRFGGDEILCVIQNGEEEDCLSRIESCRETLREKRFGGHALSASCSFGYVMGTAASNREFHEMAQLADIYVHQADRNGRGKTLGGAFDQEHLREGIVESNRSTHARPYEINQLTGLPSLSYFLARTDELLASVVDVKECPAIGFVNLVRIRDFNDVFGYAQGDELIRHTGRLLQESFPGRHICYITGSQFGLLCYQDEVEAGVERVCEGLKNYRPGFSLVLKAGFALYTGDERVVSLMDKAKIAHDSIYDRRDATFRFYDDSLDEENRFRQYLVSHIDEAAARGWLKVYYQPIARAVTGKVCAEEALSRWDDPTYGFLPPYRFISTLEESRVIYKLNLHVVRQVLSDFDRRRKLGVPVVPVSVNLSRYDFEQCDMVDEITKLVDASGWGRNMLKIEITESAFVRNPDLLRREVKRFRDRGFEVWMDDFGSEFSTLNLLEELDFDLIKIDMKFMKNFSDNGKSRIIVTEIIDMAKKMGITTLVEGVETVEHYYALKTLGCEKLQGYLFNKPNPLDYIVNRANSGGGLTFENQYEAPYYREIGMIDLDVPFTSGDQNSFQLSRELSDGILEQKGDTLTCIRGTERFARELAELGMREEDAAPSRSYGLQPSEELKSAIQRSRATKKWANFIIVRPGKRDFSCYLRVVAENEQDGCTAFLAVLLPVASK